MTGEGIGTLRAMSDLWLSTGTSFFSIDQVAHITTIGNSMYIKTVGEISEASRRVAELDTDETAELACYKLVEFFYHCRKNGLAGAITIGTDGSPSLEQF